MPNPPIREGFQPIPVQSPEAHPWAFRLRCIVDLQLATIVQFLQPALGSLQGRVLDVGAGQSPWRSWLPKTTEYLGIDVGHAGEFGMDTQRSDVIYYDGLTMPLADNSFDAVLCVEVLEHAEDPQLLLTEILRVLKLNGCLLLTVPWSARRHHIPHDYHRFTRERLSNLLIAAGFTDIQIKERGNDICAISNKLIVLTLRMLRPSWRSVPGLPIAMLCALCSVGFLLFAHLSLGLGLGSRDDPLGYYLEAKK